MKPRWSEITALFGGTFDPPHLGHREAIRGLFERPGVRRALLLPSPAPPHKPSIASAEDRIEMARLGLTRGLPGEVRIDSREIDRARRAPGVPSYSYDTLQEFRREIPDHQMAFVIGTDQLEKLHTWHRFPEILGLCHWIVLERKPAGPAQAQAAIALLEGSGLIRKAGDSSLWQTQGGASFLHLVPTDAPDLSSTAIRESLVRSGQPPEGALHPEVLSYLMAKRLYGTGESR